MKTPCCNYEIDNQRPPVMWNEFNGVVQCHNCGQVYAPKLPMTRAARLEGIAVHALAAILSNPKLLTSRKGVRLTDAQLKEVAGRKAVRAAEYAEALAEELDRRAMLRAQLTEADGK